MSAYANIFASGGATSVNFLNQCVLEGATDYIFEFCVMDYKTAATKKKAIALFDIFCATTAPLRLNADEGLPPRNLQLGAIIDLYRDMHAVARGMNFFKRVMSSSNRAAEATQFDFLLPMVFRQEDTQMMDRLKGASNKAVTAPTDNKSFAYKQLNNTWKPCRTTLIGAGFKKLSCTLGG